MLAAKYSIALDWEAVSKDVVLSAESAEGSKATNGETQVSAAAFEAVEQKLKTKAQRRSAHAERLRSWLRVYVFEVFEGL